MPARYAVRIPVAIGLLVALCAGALAWLPGAWDSSLDFSDYVARHGGQRRTVPLPGRSPAKVVLSRNTKWCQCPGLAVAFQLALPSVDSAFAISSALLRALQPEAEHGPGRCFTVHIQVGAGHHWPWQSPVLYLFSWYYAKNGRWQHFGFSVPPADVGRAQSLTKAWAA
jgi:hypothetical protein